MARSPRFYTKSYRLRAWWARARWPIFIGAILLAWLAIGTRPDAQPQTIDVGTIFTLCGEGGSSACVIDGDTVAIGRRRVRLTGYDSPELDGACEAERVAALAARRELHAWLAKGRFSWTGGTEPPYDRYGRELREARRGADLLSDHMIDAGLAQGSGWGAERVEWCL